MGRDWASKGEERGGGADAVKGVEVVPRKIGTQHLTQTGAMVGRPQVPLTLVVQRNRPCAKGRRGAVCG